MRWSFLNLAGSFQSPYLNMDEFLGFPSSKWRKLKWGNYWSERSWKEKCIKKWRSFLHMRNFFELTIKCLRIMDASLVAQDQHSLIWSYLRILHAFFTTSFTLSKWILYDFVSAFNTMVRFVRWHFKWPSNDLNWPIVTCKRSFLTKSHLGTFNMSFHSFFRDAELIASIRFEFGVTQWPQWSQATWSNLYLNRTF